MSRALQKLLFLFALAACGRGPSAHTPAGAAGACWPVRPLELQALEHGAEWEPMSAVEADGQIVHLAKGRRPMARLDGDRLVGGFGKVAASCNERLEIVLDGKVSGAHYDAEGAFVERGIRIFVADDGVVHMTSHGTKVFGPGGKGQARVQGAVAEARRTAALLVLLSLGGPPG